ncbi:uncharacterized protein BYT42DRAFT_480305, partial [Radiomyces spectabilis]|uniref:uncharacterized protein n=1 Tax=Radiomyces spectabilis TaxID=64574 RepID=UPI00221EF9F6
ISDLRAELRTEREERRQLQALVTKMLLEQSVATRTVIAPKPAATGAMASKYAPAQAPKAESYSDITKKHVPKKTSNHKSQPAPKTKKISEKIVVRTLQESTGPSQYKFIYVPCRHRLRQSDVRKMLSTLKIQQNRILDIHFPSRGVVGLLVHDSFEADLRAQFTKNGVAIKDFDPLAPAVIADPKHAEKTDDERRALAKQLSDERILRACTRLPPMLGNSIAAFF